MEFCTEHSLSPTNTWKQKAQEQLITWRGSNKNDFAPPFHHTDYGQMDFLLLNRPWKSAVTNITSFPHLKLDSDHKLVLADVHVKFAKKRDPTTEMTPKCYPPTHTEIATYNKGISEILTTGSDNGENIITLQKWSELLTQAMSDSFTPMPKEQRKDYIARTTWDLMQQRLDLIRQQKFDEAANLNKEIKKQLRRDKEEGEEEK